MTSDDRLIIGKILLSAIDMNKNISHLSRSGSWGDASGFNVSKSVSTPTSIRRQSLTLIAWIYENMKMEDNTAQNYLVFYQVRYRFFLCFINVNVIIENCARKFIFQRSFHYSDLKTLIQRSFS